MKRWLTGAAAVAALTVLTSCGQDSQQSAQVNYNEVKSMVVDILKTEDGQKAIEEASKKVEASDFQQLQILNTGQGQQLQLAVKEVMSDPAYSAALKEAMIDPKFAGDFAKAITTENKKIQKDLMKDPEYQQAMIDILKDPQMQAMLFQTMKSSEYRQQIKTVVLESIESPLFQQELLKLMERALEEQAKPKPDAEKGAKASKAAEEEKKKKEEEKKKKEEEESL
jgi:spore germination protein D